MWKDLADAARGLRRKPAFVALVTLTLGLGLGAATGGFALVDALLLARMPFAHEERLVRLFEHDVREGRPFGQLTVADFRAYREGARSLSNLALLRRASFTLGLSGEPVRATGARVSGSLFGVLGVSPALGRTLTQADERAGAPCTAVIAHGLWQRSFGADPGVVGRPIVLADAPCTVVGVLPARFVSPIGGDASVYVADAFDELAADPQRSVRMHAFSAVGRLAAGASLETARAELDAIGLGLERLRPQENGGHRPHLVRLRDGLVRDARPTVGLLAAAVALLLVLATTNVAGITLSRALAGRRDLAVHQALGATRFRIARRLVCEAVLLALLGGACGALLASAGVSAFVQAVGGGDFPVPPTLGWRVLVFGMLAALASGVACGLVPAVAGTGLDLTAALKAGGRLGQGAGARPRVRAALVAAQVALAVVLLVGCGLLLRTVVILQRADPGFSSAGVWVFRTTLRGARYGSRSAVTGLVERYLERLRSVPGVSAAAAAYTIPFENTSTTSLREVGQPRKQGPDPEVGYNSVTTDYFRALSIPLRRGRAFAPGDAERGPVLIVNEALAARFFPGTDPVGRRVHVGNDEGAAPAEIVGVVGDVRRSGLDSGAEPEAFLLLGQDTTSDPVFVVRTTAGAGLVAAAAREMKALDGGLPVYGARPLADLVAQTLAARRVVLALLAVFGAVALVLSAVAIGGVVAQMVAARRHEIGVRLAVGASPVDVLRLVMAQGLRPLGGGIAAGLAGAAASARFTSALVSGIAPTDPLTFALAAAVIGAVGVAAAWLPGRRAAALDPRIALGSE